MDCVANNPIPAPGMFDGRCSTLYPRGRFLLLWLILLMILLSCGAAAAAEEDDKSMRCCTVPMARWSVAVCLIRSPPPPDKDVLLAPADSSSGTSRSRTRECLLLPLLLEVVR